MIIASLSGVLHPNEVPLIGKPVHSEPVQACIAGVLPIQGIVQVVVLPRTWGLCFRYDF